MFNTFTAPEVTVCTYETHRRGLGPSEPAQAGFVRTDRHFSGGLCGAAWAELPTHSARLISGTRAETRHSRGMQSCPHPAVLVIRLRHIARISILLSGRQLRRSPQPRREEAI